jgi:hypothetical protein
MNKHPFVSVMKTISVLRAVALLLLGFFLVGATECQPNPRTVVAPQLGATDQLLQEKDKQIQDIKDTSEATGSKLWNEAREHFIYRLGDKNGFWGQVVQKKLVQNGLIAAPVATSVAAPAAPTPAKQS